MLYTIIDVETTGKTNRITEISIFKFDGNKIVEEFTSLVNPQDLIPDHITALTGIDNEMVYNAPLFSEIAQEVLNITKGTTFVAHNVNFDYNVINGEFKRLNIDFKRKKLCTIRLSRKLLPGHKSYSLGKLCKDLNINLSNRHRAKGDAEATVILFKLLLQQKDAEEVFTSFLKGNSKQGTLPPNLPASIFEAIPNKPGIYYFKNKKNEIIYVGKAIDLKKRVLSHFYNKKKKELDLCRETADINFELSGSKLITLLMEDAAIKQHFPEYNVASKKTVRPYAILNYVDRNGVIPFAINTLKLTPNPLAILYSKRDALSFIEALCSKFELCPKFCHLQEGVDKCNHYKIKTCKGICINEESVALYNLRVKQAQKFIVENYENQVIKQPGRELDEEAFVQVKNGIYQGYGFINSHEQISNESELDNFIIPQKDNFDVQRILRNYSLS